MAKLTILDILALSKSGYKKADIDELLKTDIPTHAPTEEVAGAIPVVPAETSEKEVEEVKEVEVIDKDDKEVEELKKQVADLTSKLENAQKKNKDIDISDKKVDNNKYLQDLVDSFF